MKRAKWTLAIAALTASGAGVAAAMMSMSGGTVKAMSDGNGKNGRAEMLAKPVNERFASLREFLAWQDKMRKRIADFPWYEEISPGVFRYHRSRGQSSEQTEFDEKELREKLGFNR
jgi:hypothetical protein